MEYKEWTHQRETFKWLSYVMIFLYGFEMQTTKYFLLYYLKDRFHIQTSIAIFYYSVTEALYSIAQIIGGAFLGRYMDRTRNLRRVVVGVMLASFAGNSLYVLHGQIWLVVIGRILMGFTECLQTAVIGEIRRTYAKEVDTMKQVIGWYEVSYQIGINIGAGIPILFTGILIRIGFVKLDKLNMGNLLITVGSLALAIVSYFKVTDLSKNLERIESKNYTDALDLSTLNESRRTSHIRCSKLERADLSTADTKCTNNDSESTPSQVTLMKFSDLFNFDIITLCLAYGMGRYGIATLISSMTIIPPSMYGWSLNTLLIVVIVTNCVTLILSTLLVKYAFFKDPVRNFYLYIISLITCAVMVTALMLTNIGILNTLPQQIIFFSILYLSKNPIFLQGQIVNTFLLLQTVNAQDSSFITGVRTVAGITFKGISFLLAFYSSHYPQYHSPVVAMVTLLMAVLVLWRRDIHLRKKLA
ncbi:uncharacterized protein [Clytia hemisphaerica]|uniref:uncharacterized protein n=1 Tax=Clytia hemisphaerica TaxID=252671 RepID=UPI0034D6DF0E